MSGIYPRHSAAHPLDRPSRAPASPPASPSAAGVRGGSSAAGGEALQRAVQDGGRLRPFPLLHRHHHRRRPAGLALSRPAAGAGGRGKIGRAHV